MSPYKKVQERMSLLGIAPKRSLGQNFLIERAVIDKIMATVARMRPEALIEVGPGLGALTDGLLARAQPLVLLELDRLMAQHWRGQGLEVVEGDAVRADWSALARPGTCLVSNLPYQISSTLVIDRALGPVEVQSMVLMFQKEVAQRVAAVPRTAEYGVLSVMAQTFFNIERVVEASPACFYPRPQIASRVLAFRRRLPAPPVEGPAFLRLVKTAFAQRRKKLINNLSCYKMIEHVFATKGISTNIRAEEMAPSDFVELFCEVQS
jgi:16S rRNA (adenine1518-N6/adenine1519-N6)-dimethyltransferase